jgi:hypothetical protein
LVRYPVPSLGRTIYDLSGRQRLTGVLRRAFSLATRTNNNSSKQGFPFMSETKEHDAYYTSPVIQFDNIALLGAATNGAAPQQIHGLFVTANICESDGKPSGGYWLMVNTQQPKADDLDHFEAREHVIYVQSAKDVETILGGIVNASTNPNFTLTIPQKVSGWHNQAQINFDEEIQEDCVYDLTCRIRTSTNGFQLFLSRPVGHTSENVASINAKLSNDGIETALKIVREVNSWTQDQHRIIEQQVEAKEASEFSPRL